MLADQAVTFFISLTGTAEAAMNFYAQVLPDCFIKATEYYKDDDPMGAPGKVITGILLLKGTEIMFMDMPFKYPAPVLNWAITPLIKVESEDEFYCFFDSLRDGGSVMMGPEPVLNMKLCTWLTDKYGLTWQLVLV